MAAREIQRNLRILALLKEFHLRGTLNLESWAGSKRAGKPHKLVGEEAAAQGPGETICLSIGDEGSLKEQI
jgi:hypothetical protein